MFGRSSSPSDRPPRSSRPALRDRLRDASRAQLKDQDEDGMSPALWAACDGDTEALRLIVSRGGDVDQCDLWGNSALHLAAAHGHKKSLCLLVSLGANIWSLDNDFHTPLDVAAAHSHMDCVRFLDAAAATQITLKPKVSGRAQDQDCARIQKKHQRKMERKFMKEAASMDNMDAASLSSYGSGSYGSGSHGSGSYGSGSHGSGSYGSGSYGSGSMLRGYSGNNPVTYSQAMLQSRGRAGLQRKAERRRQDEGFRVSEDGRRSVRSLSGLRLGNDVMFLRHGTYRERGKEERERERTYRERGKEERTERERKRPEQRDGRLRGEEEDAVSIATSDTSVSRAMSDPGLYEAALSEASSADSGRDSLSPTRAGNRGLQEELRPQDQEEPGPEQRGRSESSRNAPKRPAERGDAKTEG
ncbi:hypothetical protein WMY93_033209 [Mugilogobius chulae]|uniref:Usher syndrome type-1G protein n=1 Tax=Mugilogobius chulae TaxID=88201 RepID=A0AAW0MTY5_9GOBI